MTKHTDNNIIYIRFEYKSKLAPHINKFIEVKRQSGLLYNNEARTLYILDRFIQESHYNTGELSKECVHKFISQYNLDEFKSSTVYNIGSILSRFGRYLLCNNINAYVLPRSYLPTRCINHGYIPTHEQMIELCAFLDRKVMSSPRLNYSFISKMIMMRVLYVCGMRVSEVVNLRISHVDLERGKIMVRHGKGRVSRDLPIRDDLKNMLIRYEHFISPIAPKRKYFFITRKGKFNRNALTNWFKYWWKECFPDSTEKTTPNLHALRHAMIVRSIDLLNEESEHDFNNMLPVLSEFLGHCSVNNTLYYYHIMRGHSSAISKSIKANNDVAWGVANACSL